jgi:phage replication-related protein YjqB (UPF0714/DUF867 family)
VDQSDLPDIGDKGVMTMLRRRTLLGAMTAVAAVPVVNPAPAVAADLYASNSDLYRDRVEGADFSRRARRRDVFDDDLTQRGPVPLSTVVAPHGGGIEPGTSELCLAIAGFHPATLAPTGGPTHDYWMLEGLLSTGNDILHVTSTHCDDAMALSLCGGARTVLSLHGCSVSAADGLGEVLVGGRNVELRGLLITRLTAAGFDAVDATGHPSLGGVAPENLTNRTLLGAGAQLEIVTPVRNAMFGVNTRPQRKHTTTPTFWSFTDACRAALATWAAGQEVL